MAESDAHSPPQTKAHQGHLIRLAVLIAALAVIGTGAWVVFAGSAGVSDPLARQFNLDDLQLNRADILSGGVPKDGIPALTKPATVPAGDIMPPNYRVVSVTIKDQTRAYPINILNWHEIINDTLAGVPIAVIYCPLCDSVSVVDRRINDQTLEFGVSGQLANSNVLMYDRTDQALWSQVALTAISGPNAGKSLKHLPFEITRYHLWRDRHPDASVISFDTGHRIAYNVWAYGDYFQHDRISYPLSHHDDRLPVKTRVIGIQLGDTTRAYPIDAVRLADDGELTDTLGKARITLRAAGPGTVRIVEAPPKAKIVHTFWFAWAAFHPDTELYGQAERNNHGAQP